MEGNGGRGVSASHSWRRGRQRDSGRVRAHEMTRSPENATPSGTVVQLKSRLHAGEQPGWSASAWTAATAKIASTPHSLRPASGSAHRALLGAIVEETWTAAVAAARLSRPPPLPPRAARLAGTIASKIDKGQPRAKAKKRPA